jgi:hypothetical protein
MSNPEPMPGPEPMKLTREQVEWVRQQTNLEEMIAELREVEATGGFELRDFLHELEQTADLNE